MSRRVISIVVVLVAGPLSIAADNPPLVTGVPAQPLWTQVQRVVEAMDLLGHPFPEATKRRLKRRAKKPTTPP